MKFSVAYILENLQDSIFVGEICFEGNVQA
jgi:hypothetical protein